MRSSRALLVALLGSASACASVRPAITTPSRAASGDAYRIDMFDVGTGLSILVSGTDFTLLYDGGSNDDLALGADNRLLGYLGAALGPPGSAACPIESTREEGARIDHLFLSHPHRDHLAFLPEVLDCYEVRNIWDSGFGTISRGYAAFLERAEREPRATRRSPRRNPRTPRDRWLGFEVPSTIALGRGAKATILAANAFASDPNDASIVVRVDLGTRSLLLMGDATGGKRLEPSHPASEDSTEGKLLERDPKILDVDILQVGHHGSMTSTRKSFLDATSPKYALVSSGPRRYGDVRLPDASVLFALRTAQCEILRTDLDDTECRSAERKVGPLADGSPGGCDAHTISIGRSGDITVHSQRPHPTDKPAAIR